jgi:hypothetical protein
MKSSEPMRLGATPSKKLYCFSDDNRADTVRSGDSVVGQSLQRFLILSTQLRLLLELSPAVSPDG